MSATKTKKPKAAKQTKPKAAKPQGEKTARKGKGNGKMSAIEAAAKVLADAGEPLNTRQMIEAMAAKGLWSSPNGKTPWATLYSSLLREITEKGKDARFVKADRGKFEVKK